MFERFTARARNAVVAAQEEARLLDHNYIGTEHLLLGLLRQEDGVAARALAGLDVSLERARQQVLQTVGRGKAARAGSGHIPFTPRAKKVLELSLREALRMGHNYIGTEHVLLGLVREGDGVAAQVLLQGLSLERVRQQVTQQLALLPPGEPATRMRRRRPRWLSGLVPWLASGSESEPEEPWTTPAAERGLAEMRRLAGPGPIGSHHLALAALAEPNGAAAQALAALGVELERAREAMRRADVSGTADDLPEEAGRRRMTLRLSEDLLTVELSDPAIVRDARQAFDALRPQLDRPDVLPGELPAAASLGHAWDALRQSLRAIRAAGAPVGEETGRLDAPSESE